MARKVSLRNKAQQEAESHGGGLLRRCKRRSLRKRSGPRGCYRGSNGERENARRGCSGSPEGIRGVNSLKKGRTAHTKISSVP